MTTANTSRKPAHPQGNAWQETLQDYKDQMTKQQQKAADALKKAKGKQSDRRDFDPRPLNALHQTTNI